MVDSVEENLQASRRLLLLYTASTFIKKRHTSSTSSNNNNISKSSETNIGDGEKVYLDSRQNFVCKAAMHKALVEGSLKVRHSVADEKHKPQITTDEKLKGA